MTIAQKGGGATLVVGMVVVVVLVVVVVVVAPEPFFIGDLSIRRVCCRLSDQQQ